MTNYASLVTAMFINKQDDVSLDSITITTNKAAISAFKAEKQDKS